MKYYVYFLLVMIMGYTSCKEKKVSSEETQVTENVAILEPHVDISELTSNFNKWWTYHWNTISLSSDFTGLNATEDTIAKRSFLEKLQTGHYIPLRIKSESEDVTYKLFKLDSSVDESIGTTIKNQAISSLKHFDMEGQEFPKFNFIDLNGNHYTTENTQGKTIILKTWFINCTACVAEFPELNEFVEKYKKNDDVVFVSLALDSKNKLDAFLQKKHFEYQVIPKQKEFIKKLNLEIYPTHLVIDKHGKIVKVVNRASEMIAFFENNEKIETSKIVPPPPPTSATPPPPPPPTEGLKRGV